MFEKFKVLLFYLVVVIIILGAINLLNTGPVCERQTTIAKIVELHSRGATVVFADGTIDKDYQTLYSKKVGDIICEKWK